MENVFGYGKDLCLLLIFHYTFHLLRFLWSRILFFMYLRNCELEPLLSSKTLEFLKIQTIVKGTY